MVGEIKLQRFAGYHTELYACVTSSVEKGKSRKWTDVTKHCKDLQVSLLIILCLEYPKLHIRVPQFETSAP
jgi:hypothetical protein